MTRKPKPYTYEEARACCPKAMIGACDYAKINMCTLAPVHMQCELFKKLLLEASKRS